MGPPGARRAGRALAAAAALVAACGGGRTRPAPEPAPAESEPQGPRALSAPAAPPTPACRRAYREYVRTWGNWFAAELGAGTAAEIVAEFGQELPTRAALAEMREVADGLRYEPGFDLWFAALTATERAIEICGEGAARPGP
jgi:hypothetical protein